MTHYLKRMVTLTDSLDVTPSGLGYKYWLAFTGRMLPTSLENASRRGDIDARGFEFHVHPFIKANAAHSEDLGVEVGQWIAGIRWVDELPPIGVAPNEFNGRNWDTFLADLERKSDETVEKMVARENKRLNSTN